MVQPGDQKTKISVGDCQKEKSGKTGWGVENHPYPKGVAYIHTREDLCVGCGICEMACSFFHFGVINRELSRIRIHRYFTPIPKAVQNVCSQCEDNERECEKACPLEPPVIRYDGDLMHMVVDTSRCLGAGCARCLEACTADVPRFTPEHDYPLVCDLCEKEGVRMPQCVEVCPGYALEYKREQFPRYLDRIHPDEKAESFSRRLYPLPRNAAWVEGEP